MAMTVLSVAVVLLVPVGIGWRIALNLLQRDPTPQVKLAFWALSALFVVLAGAAFVATRYI